MGALTIAFDTTIVGALALPWVILVIHLFFLQGESSIEVLLRWIRKQNQPAVAGVLLFAMAYTLGSAVSRTAQDFFNDNDLHVELDGLMFRDGVTENRILTSVYCDSNKSNLLPPGEKDAVVAEKIGTIRSLQRADKLCRQTLSWTVSFHCDATEAGKHDQGSQDFCPPGVVSPSPGSPENSSPANSSSAPNSPVIVSGAPNAPDPGWLQHAKENHAKQDRELNQAAYDLFGLQENALMDKGGDYTVRLRQLHDQVMVLRGAAFNGVIAFSLCLFGLGAKFRRDHGGSWVRWAFWPLPVLYLIVGIIAVGHHFFDRVPSDPPYMEFTLLLLAAAGAWLLWRKPKQSSGQAPASHHDKPAVVANTSATKSNWLDAHWPPLVVVSAILTAATVLGWWSTEVLYAEQVIYSYDSMNPVGPGTTAAQP
jgi:hypothetical protein